MTLLDFRRSGDCRPQPPGEPAGDDSLGLDDLVSRSGDDLGLDVDPAGQLVLVEGCDFD